MRIFEFLPGEVLSPNVGIVAVNLDAAIAFQTDGYYFGVVFSSGLTVSLTKPAFDRIFIASKSK